MQFFLPARLDPLHESSVTKNTLDRYRRAVHKFDSFLHSEHATPGTAAELDSWLVRYRQASQLTRSNFEQTVAALEFFSPGLKGQLGYSKRVIRGLVKQTPVQHAVPLTSQVAKYMAMCMARVKLFRIAVGMLVQVATGLRPCEMLNLRQKHVMEPTAAIRRFVLRLGANVGTKVQREQVTFLDWDKDVDISKLFLRLLRATPGEEQLFPCSYSQYRRILAHFCAPLGVRFTPHSGRAGFATEATIQGLDPTVIRRLGRWQSETSFQVYIDVVTALEVEVTYCARAVASDIRQAVEQLRKHFPLGCFNIEADESTTQGCKHGLSRRAFPISVQTTGFAQRRVSTQNFNTSAHGSSSTSCLTRIPTSLGRRSSWPWCPCRRKPYSKTAR